MQRCRDDGSGYEACVCPGDGTSGAGGSAGTQSSAGTGGKGGNASGGKGGNASGGKGGNASGGKGGNATGGKGGNATGGTGTGGTQNSCQDGTIEEAIRVPSDVLLLVDKSGSMSDGANGSGPPKWASLPKGLDQGLGAEDTGARVGMLLFPAGKFDDSKLASCFFSPSSPECAPIVEDGGCTDVDAEPIVALAPIPTAQSAIAETLKAQTPAGGTPMRFALKQAWTHLAGTTGAQERAVILVTDGQPNTFGSNSISPNLNKACGTLDDLRADTAAAADGSPSVRTFVIVLPGDAEPGLMSGLAVRGKTGKPGCTLQNAQTKECHTQLDSGDYATALGPAVADAIARASRGCVFTTGEAALASPDTTELLVDGATVPRDPTRTNGWDYLANDPAHFQVYGAACEALREKADAKAQLAVACKP